MHRVGPFFIPANSFWPLMSMAASSLDCTLWRNALDCCPFKVLLTPVVPGRCLGTWIWGGFASFPEKCLNCLYGTLWCMLNTCFPSGSLEFWDTLEGGHPGDRWAVKPLKAEPLMSVSGWQHCTLSPGKIKECYVTPRGEDSGSLHPISSRLCADVSLPFDCALYPFTVITAVSTTVCLVPWVLPGSQHTCTLHLTHKNKLNLGYWEHSK